MLHFEVELEVAYELSSRLHYLHYITLDLQLTTFKVDDPRALQQVMTVSLEYFDRIQLLARR